MSETNWEADKMLDVYIYDYFVKRGLKLSAQAFKTEGKISSDPVAIDAPGGFLLEWWSVFWDIFIARTNGKRADVAASYLQSQLMKAREQQHQQQLLLRQPQHPQIQQHMQMQQLLFQRQAQQQQNLQSQPQQQREGSHLLSVTANGIGGNDSHGKQSPGSTANAPPANMCEEKLKLPGQRDPLDDAAMKQKLGNNSSSSIDNHASILKAAAAPGQPSGRVSPGPAGGMSPHVQPRNQQFSGSTPDIKTEMNPILNTRASGFEGSLIGTPGSNQGGNNLTLKGWPLTGLDQLRPGLLQQPKSLMQGSQPFNQSQILTPQYQQQLMMAQHNVTSSSVDLESRRMRLLLNNQNHLVGKDGLSNSADNVAPNVMSSLQAGGSMLSHMDPEMFTKFKLAQMQQQQQQSGNLPQQHVPSGQHSQISNHILQQEKITATGNTTGGGSMSNSFNGNDQGSTNQTGRKRKQATSSPGPANNSTGTVNTAGLSPSSAPSTPSIHTAGDAMPMHALPHSASYSKPLMTFGADNSGILKAPSNQLWDDKGSVPTDMDRLVDDVEDNVESFLSSDDADIRGDVGRGMDANKGFTFMEVSSVRASSNKIVCCHFSSDGKLLASGGHDKKVVLWYTDSLKPKSTLEEHSLLITDVRFSPSMARLATSSFDRTVRVWDADNPSYSIRNFTGHSASVMSVDFHPNNDDIICSCDDNGEIRYWSINNGNFTRVFKGGTAQVRFQPRVGRYLAAASENVVLIMDAETQACLHSLKGHTKPIFSVCWDPAGELLASMSDDTVIVWTMRPGSEGNLLHKLSCNGNKFYSCVFHPKYSSLLIVGCYQSLELWNVADNTRMTISAAHEGPIAALAASGQEGRVASASHDMIVKLWK